MELAKKENVGRTAPSSFGAIYSGWFDQVSQWIQAMGSPEADQEDLVQDVFVVVCRRLPDFDGGNLAGWLYQISRRRVRDFRRLVWVKYFLSQSVSRPENVPDEGASAAEIVETRQKSALLERLLDRLNESERAALVLFEVEGCSGAEIAQIQGVPLNTVWARIYKARKKLKGWFAKNDHGIIGT